MLRILLISFLIFSYGFSKETQDEIKQEKLRLLNKINKTFSSGDSKKIFALYKDLGNIYAKNGEYYKAVEYYKLAIKLYQTIKEQDDKEKISLYKNLAHCYKKIGNNFKTFKYTYKAIQLSNKTYGKNSQVSKKLNKEIADIQSRMIAASI